MATVQDKRFSAGLAKDARLRISSPMPRRASAPTHPVHIVIVFLLLAVAVAGGWFVAAQVADPYRTIPSLDVEAYLDNANSLRGSTFKVRGGISNQLSWSPDGRRLYSIEVDDKSPNDGTLVPVLVPEQFKGVNIQKGQTYYFEVEVIEGGMLRTKNLTKA